MAPLFAAGLVAALPTLTATVSLDPEAARLDVRLELHTVAGKEAFGLHPDLEVTSMTVDGRPAEVERDGRTMRVPAGRVVRLAYSGRLPRRGPAREAREQIVLAQWDWPWLPLPSAFMDASITVRLPEGWQVVGSGAPARGRPRCAGGTCAHGPFVGDRQPFVMLVAADNWQGLERGAVRAFVTPEHEASLEPLVAAAQAMLRAFEPRFGPRLSQTVTIVEAPIDGGFTVHGLVALNPSAVAAFATSDREEKLLAHELCHEWFGSVANGHPFMTEGISRHCELWWLREDHGEAAARAFEAELTRDSLEARPGLTLREVDYRGLPWRDYEAVAYSRGALVHARLREAIGPEQHDRWLRLHLERHATEIPSLKDSLRLLDEVAPSFDRAGFEAKYVDRDFDPRTGAARPSRLVFSARVAAGIAAALWLLALALGRGRPRVAALATVVLAAVAFVLWRSPGWVFGARAMIAVGGALVCVAAARRGRRRAAQAGLLVAIGVVAGGVALAVGGAAALFHLVVRARAAK